MTGVGNMGYDGYGRLTSAPNTSYEYNALGQRVRKSVGAANTYFHYDPDGKLLYEQTPAGTKLHYVYVNGELLARIDNSTIYYYHTDYLGTPQAMTDASGAVVWQANYDPFGKTLFKVQTITNNIRFPGQYFDQETGLSYNYFRHYDLGTGRYVQSDPIGLGGGINTFAYVDGNPISKVDPWGLYGYPWEISPNFNPVTPYEETIPPQSREQCIAICAFDFANPFPDIATEKGAEAAGEKAGGKVAGQIAGQVMKKVNKVKGVYDAAVCIKECKDKPPRSCTPDWVHTQFQKP